MKNRIPFLLFLCIISFDVNLFAQKEHSMLFKDFIEISDVLDEDDRKILREDSELMKSRIYFSIDEAKKAVTANVLALSIDNYQRENHQKYFDQLSDLAYFPNLKFFISSFSYFNLTNNKKLKYIFLKQYSIFSSQSGFVEPVFFESIGNVTLAKLEDRTLNECPMYRFKNLRKASFFGKIDVYGLNGLVNYPNLDNLDLSSNNFKNAPPQPFIPAQIKKMNLSNNKLGKSEFLALKYPSLKSLNISNNDIKLIKLVDLPELTDLDLSDNLFSNFPDTIIHGIPKLKVLDMSNNKNIGTYEDFSAFENLDSLDVSGTKVNQSAINLINLRLAIPNTTIVFYYNTEGNKVVSGKIEPDKITELKNLKSGWVSGEFAASVKFGKYFLEKCDIAYGDYIFNIFINTYPEIDYNTTLAIATYLDNYKLTNLSAKLFRRIISINPLPDFKKCFLISQKLQANHIEMAKEFLPSVMNHDSLQYYLNNRMFRIEYTSLLYNCNHLAEAERLFDQIVEETGLENDKEMHDLAKYFEKNNCHTLAIKLYEKIIESPKITSEEKKLFASLSIADIYKDKNDNNSGYSFVHYEGVCYKDFSNDQSKAIILQGCNKAYDSYQDQISVFLAEHKQQLTQMKKKVQRAATAKNIGTAVNSLGSFASMIPGAGNIAPVLDMSSRISSDVTNAIASNQMASYDLLSSDAFSIEEKIAFLESKKDLIDFRINELNHGNKEVAVIANTNKEEEKMQTKPKIQTKSNQNSSDSDDFFFTYLASYNMLNKDYSKTFEHLHKALKSDQIPIDLKLELYFNYYVNELNTNKVFTNSMILSEALLTAHPDDPMVVSLYSNLQIANRNFDEAIRQLEKVRQKDPANYQIIGKLFFLYDKTEEWIKLKELSQDAVGNFTNIFLPYYYLGICLFHLDKYQEAIDALEKCLALIKPETEVKPYTLAILGRCYSETGSFEKSESYFLQAMSLTPNDVRIKMQFCYGLLAQPDRMIDAENLAKEIIASDNMNPDICDLYAFTLFNNGNYNEAKTWALKAINNNNNTKGLAYEHYGDILYKLGNTSQAVVYWNLAKSKGKNVSKNIDKKIETKAYVE
jgi:tetratricopeptide (TPR) repeat protein